MEEEVFPGDLALLVPSHAAEHAAKRRLHTCGDLVVGIAGGDAFDEGAFLVAVGEGEIVGKAAVGGKLAGAGGGTDCGVLPAPGLCARDLDGAGVGYSGRADGTVQPEPRVEGTIVAKLGGRKGEMHVLRVDEVHLVVVPAVAGMRKDVAAACSRGLQRVGAQDPVAEIDDVDVLLDEDVAGKCPVPEPIAKPELVG